MKHYYQLEIPYNSRNESKVYELLYKHGFNSILEENGILILTKPENELGNLIILMEELHNKKIITSEKLYLDRLEFQDWNKEWERTIEPVYIKNKIIVTPSWHKEKLKLSPDKIVIIIDPKMSFGTGHNETTQMMLEMMCDHIIEIDKTMLDYGTGTGILAIAGIKLGLKEADAIDIDDDSILNAKDYIKQNKVTKKINLLKADITDIKAKKYDIITANINRTVITKNIKEIYNRLKQNGKLFITGILQEEDDTIVKTLKKNNFELIEKHFKAEWVSYFAIKK